MLYQQHKPVEVRALASTACKANWVIAMTSELIALRAMAICARKSPKFKPV